MRRVFYSGGPWSVVGGFLLTAACVDWIWQTYPTSVWELPHPWLGACLGLQWMLSRERVILDGRTRLVTVESWLFVLPLGRKTYPFELITDLKWVRVVLFYSRGLPSESVWDHYLLELSVDGAEVRLLRRSLPDPAQREELRKFLGLPLDIH